MTHRPDSPAPFDVPLTYVPDVIQVSPDVEQVGSAWALIGGTEDEADLELYLVVAHPTEKGMASRLVLSIPLVAEDGVLKVGTLSVRETNG